jgi:hypothetical protein
VNRRVRSLVPMLFACTPVVSLACSCILDTTPLEERVLRAYCSADLVFVGRVTEQRPLAQHVLENRIDPIAGSKGVDTGRNKRPEYTLTGGSSCDLRYELDSTYLIFGYADDSGRYLLSSKCGPTQTILRSEAIRTMLNRFSAQPEACDSPLLTEPYPYLRLRSETLETLRQTLLESIETPGPSSTHSE